MATAIKLALRVTPRSGKDAVVGISCDESGQEEIQVKVTAAPDGGKANKAVCVVLAKSIGIPKSAITVVRGSTSRHKLVEVTAEEKVIEAWRANLARV